MKYILIGLIHCYKCIPGDFHNHCNFTPTCSTYAITAIERFGALKGTFLTIKRIMHCNPFHKFSYDPVPEGDIK